MLAFNDLSYWEKKTYFNTPDYLIIGSGIVGLSTAIELKQREPQAKIIILERGYLPTGASTKNAGFSCFGSPSEILDDISNYGVENVRETIKLRALGLEKLKSRLGEATIEYNPCGSYDLFTEKDKTSYIECVKQLPFLNELIFDTIGLRDCYSDVENVDKLEFSGIIGAIFNQYEGSINTGEMMKSLLALASTMNIQILNSITVNKISSEKLGATVQTDFGEILARKVLLCTNGLTKKLYSTVPLLPARAQVIVTSPIENLKLNSTYHYDKGYYYFRVVEGNRILIGGARNADFENEQTEVIENTPLILSKIIELLKTVIIPGVKFNVDYSWAGIMGVGDEKKPFISELEPNVYCAVRLGGMGVAMGSEVGSLLVNKVHL